MSVFGDYHSDVVFDFSYADDLVRQFQDCASSVERYNSSRASAQTTAEADFNGHFSELFRCNMQVAANDSTRLASALRQGADAVDFLITEARKENQRRRLVREYLARHDNWWEQGLDWLFGQEDPPRFAPNHLPSRHVPSAVPGERSTPLPKTQAGPGTTSSARPANLRSAASLLIEPFEEVNKRVALHSKVNGFSAVCQYGNLEVGDLMANLARWAQLNSEDGRWLRVIADAFAAAGGEEEISSVHDAALHEAFRNANIATTREGLSFTPIALSGFDPHTGYALDPVNTATGNFVEPEVDYSFGGASSSLRISRMYNSVSTDGGVFGTGWMSLLDQRIVLSADDAIWIQEDGRQIVFPRVGSQFGRAVGANFWLVASEEQGQRVLRAQDNEGGVWIFSARGRWLSSHTGQGTGVHAVYAADRVVALVHERGRRVDVDYVGGVVGRIRTSNGHSVEYVYDDRRRLVEVLGPAGRRRYEWNDKDLIVRVVDAAGLAEVENTYDADRRVIHQATPHGRRVRFAYLPGRVTAVSDEDGTRNDTWIADSNGRLIGVIDSHGQRQSMSYDSHGNLVQVTDRAGATTVHVYDSRGHRTRTVLPTGGELSYSWDELDRISTVVAQSGGVVSYVYASDEDRNPHEIHDPLGGVTRLTWEGGLLMRVVDPVGVEVSFTYDAFGDMIGATNADGATVVFERDWAGRVISSTTPMGAVTALEYDHEGHVCRARDPEGAVWRFEHDDAGRMTATIDPYGARTTFEYGEHGSLARVTDPLGRITEHEFDDLGNIAALNLPDGAQFLYEYDSLSRLTRMRAPDAAWWHWTYDQRGVMTSVQDPTGVEYSQSVDPVNGTLTYQGGGDSGVVDFDAFGRPVREQTGAGTSAILTWDAAGNVVEILDGEGGLTRLERDIAGRVRTHITPKGVTTRYEYDLCGRLLSLSTEGGGTTTFAYDADSRVVGRRLSTGEEARYSYDACSRLVQADVPGRGRSVFTYDKCGRLTYQRDPLMGIRRFSYDAAGQLVTATNGVGGVTRYAYDSRGRLVSVTDPLGGVTRYTYNSLDQITSVVDPLGHETLYSFDAAGRLLSQVGPDGMELSFTYDEAGQPVASFANGYRLTSIERDLSGRRVTIMDHTDPTGECHEHELRFDRLGRMTARVSDGQEWSWSYDADGNRLTCTSPDGQTSVYDRDFLGRLRTFVHPVAGTVSYAYDDAGRLLSATQGDCVQEWAYSDGWPSFYGRRRVNGDVSEQELCTSVERDTWGRVTAIHASDGTYRYTYDEANQLLAVEGPDGSRSWAYDIAGRLVEEVSSSGRSVFSYNAGSQLTTRTTSSGEGQAERTSRFTYTPSGQRATLTTTTNSGGVEESHTISYAWDERGWLCATATDAAHSTTWVNALGELSRVNATSLSWDIASSTPTLTHIGATPITITPAGTHMPGAEWSHTSWRPARTTTPQSPYQTPLLPDSFTPAGIHLTPTGTPVIAGLEWMGKRLYDPATHSFLSHDPLSAAPGAIWETSPYNYAANNPLNALDPTGLNPVTDAQLNAYANTVDTSSFFGRAQENWLSWNTLASAALIIGGVLLIASGAGVGPGILFIGAGVDGMIQQLDTGQVDWLSVGATSIIGGGIGKAAVKIGSRLVLSSTGRALLGSGRELIAKIPEQVAKYAVPAMKHTAVGAGDLVSGGAAATTVEAGRRLFGISNNPHQPLSSVFADNAMPTPKNLLQLGASKSLEFGGKQLQAPFKAHIKEPFLDWKDNPLRRMPDTLPYADIDTSVDSFLGNEQYGRNPNTGGNTPDHIFGWGDDARAGGQTRSVTTDNNPSNHTMTFEWQRNPSRPVHTHEIRYTDY